MTEPEGEYVEPSSPGRYRPGRLLTLVDGVFAISMTLLALEVRIPDEVPDTIAGFNGAVGSFLLQFGVFVGAFLITSRFWLLNHRQMGRLRVVDRGLAVRTIVFLAGITSLPVATGVLFRFGSAPGAVSFGAAVLAATGALSARVWWYASSPQRDLMDVGADERRLTMIRNMLVVVTFLTAIPVAYLLPPGKAGYATWIWFMLIVVDRVTAWLHRLITRITRRSPARQA